MEILRFALQRFICMAKDPRKEGSPVRGSVGSEVVWGERFSGKLQAAAATIPDQPVQNRHVCMLNSHDCTTPVPKYPEMIDEPQKPQVIGPRCGVPVKLRRYVGL